MDFQSERERRPALRSRLEQFRDDIEHGRLSSTDYLQVLDLLLETEAEAASSQAQLDRLLSHISDLEERLIRVEQSVVFQTLRAIGTIAQNYRRKFGQALLRSPLHPLYARMARPAGGSEAYRQWSAAHQNQSAALASVETQSAWSFRPKISILIPVYQPNPMWLQQALQSVQAQSYPHWEACIAVDGDPPDWLIPDLRTLASNDPRFKFTTTNVRLGISGALNAAGQLATGEYIAFLDHDDLLSPVALHYIVAGMQDVQPDILYTDEEYVDTAGQPVRPNLKPDWSPELLKACMYMGHLLVIARTRLEEVGWFRSEYDGAQDFDAVLRITRNPVRVHHIPKVLYQWRQHPESTAVNPGSKPYAQEAGRRALRSALSRDNPGTALDIADGPIPHTYIVRRTPKPSAATIVICSRNRKLLKRCLEAVQDTRQGVTFQFVIVHHRNAPNSNDMQDVFDLFGCTTVPYTAGFNFALMNNLGAEQARHESLIFLNDDVKPLHAGWAESILTHLERPEVGIVGGRLLYPAGTIQHAGVVLGIAEGSGHIGRGQIRNDLWPWLDLTRDVSAVTGACLGIRRSVFHQVHGFDPQFPVNYNDIDLCLRVREAGYSVLFEAGAVLQHDEAMTRTPGTRVRERELFFRRWHPVLKQPDPFYNPLLGTASEEISLKPS